MTKITIGKDTVEVSEEVYLFYSFLKNCDRLPKSINELISDYQNFIGLWDNFKAIENRKANDSDFEKSLQNHILCHTIKPKTEYAHQQDFEGGQPVLYPIYSFNGNRLESMAMGGNYPIKDCHIYVKANNGKYIKIK